MTPSPIRTGIPVQDLLCTPNNTTDNNTQIKNETLPIQTTQFSPKNRLADIIDQHPNSNNTSVQIFTASKSLPISSNHINANNHFASNPSSSTMAPLHFSRQISSSPVLGNKDICLSTPCKMPYTNSSVRPTASPSRINSIPGSPQTSAPATFCTADISSPPSPFCIDNYSKRPSSVPTSPMSKARGPWRDEEDRQLLQLVQEHGPRNWSALANHIPGRVGKQLRERYMNQLNPTLKKKNWTAEEDRLILRQHELNGNKWSLIASKLKGRTDNAVKNRFNSTLKRTITRLQEERQPTDIESVVRNLHDRGYPPPISMECYPVKHLGMNNEHSFHQLSSRCKSYLEGPLDRPITKIRRNSDSFLGSRMRANSSLTLLHDTHITNDKNYDRLWDGRASSDPSLTRTSLLPDFHPYIRGPN